MKSFRIEKGVFSLVRGVSALFFFCVLANGCFEKGKEPGSAVGPGKEPPAPVTVAQVVEKNVPVELRAFGTVQPNTWVDVRSQITGELIGVHFEKGQDVKKGDLLFTIDSRPAKAAQKLAEANLARDKAQYENALSEADRQQRLFEKKIASEMRYAEARTTAAALAATMSAAKAAIQNASLNVKYAEIRSPIDGRTGDLLVHVGNLVKANDAVLVTIKQIKPIRAAFALPQRELPAIMRSLNATAGNGGKLAVRAFIPGESDASENGRVELVDNAVDPTTGTIKLWAEFGNEDSRLWPGQFVNVVLTLAEQNGAITVPTRAVQTGQQGTYVFVVGPNNSVENRAIQVDRTYGDDTIVSQGLKAGERVVTDGQIRLRPDSVISIRNEASNSAAKP